VSEPPLFIGWSEQVPKPDRRFLLGASLAAVAGAGAAGAAFGWRSLPPGPGVWAQAEVTDWRGQLIRAPYPMLVTEDAGAPRTALLVTQGKRGIAPRLPANADAVIVRASPIRRGAQLMLAAVDGPEAFRPIVGADALTLPPVRELGQVTLLGEVLDAKCWFGAMRPGYGLTHKSCAALCARGGLPLAFCTLGACGEAVAAPLFLDPEGRPHGPRIVRLVAEPVVAAGRLVETNGLTEFRAAPKDIRLL
jgi:hypothetical protein